MLTPAVDQVVAYRMKHLPVYRGLDMSLEFIASVLYRGIWLSIECLIYIQTARLLRKMAFEDEIQAKIVGCWVLGLSL